MSGQDKRSKIMKKYFDECTTGVGLSVVNANNGSITTTYGTSWTDSGSFTIDTPTGTIDSKYWTYTPARQGTIINKKGGDDDMRYLYEVILVNPKKDFLFVEKIIARSETSALMRVYKFSNWEEVIEFDDLKTSCRVLMEWKKEKSLKKAIETIKEAVE